MFGMGSSPVFLLFLLLIYFLPTIVAKTRSHSNFIGVFLLNFLLGWTLLGWIASFIWSFVDANKKISDHLNNQKKCPKCAEIIKREAKVCRYCGNEFSDKDINQRMKVLDGVPASQCDLCNSSFPSSEIEIIKGKTVCPSCYSVGTA